MRRTRGRSQSQSRSGAAPEFAGPPAREAAPQCPCSRGGSPAAASWTAPHQTDSIQVVRYLDLAETLRLRIAEGASGALPSEAALGAEFSVSRVTVRRALEALREEGLVHSRRGAGWFVAVDPIRQPLGRITTLEGALEAAGAVPSRRVLEFAFEPAPPEVAKTLGLPDGGDGGESLRVTRLNLADGEPFALVTVWVPAVLGAPPEPCRRRAVDVHRPAPAARRGAGTHHPDDHHGRGRARRGAAPRRSARVAAARLSEGHLRSCTQPRSWSPTTATPPT